MIEFSNVFLQYTKEFFALYDINFKIENGEKVCFLGGQDSGKSSIIRIIAGLEKPTKGEVYIKGIPLAKIDYANDIKAGYIPYKGSFLDRKTVEQNLKYVLKLRKFSEAEQQALINKVLIDFKIEAIKDTKAGALSLYDKYVVSVARMSFREVELVLIDNIFKDLTAEENKKLMALLKKQFVKPGVTLVYAGSDEDTAKELSSRIIKLEHGAIEK